ADIDAPVAQVLRLSRVPDAYRQAFGRNRFQQRLNHQGAELPGGAGDEDLFHGDLQVVSRVRVDPCWAGEGMRPMTTARPRAASATRPVAGSDHIIRQN